MDGDQIEYNYSGQAFNELIMKIRDLEEKQGILKDRLLLLGRNVIEIKEKNIQDNLEIKKEMQSLKQNTEKMISFIENLSGEISKFAKKEDLEILTKQAKMFQPLEFVRKSEITKLNDFEKRREVLK